MFPPICEGDVAASIRLPGVLPGRFDALRIEQRGNNLIEISHE